MFESKSINILLQINKRVIVAISPTCCSNTIDMVQQKNLKNNLIPFNLDILYTGIPALKKDE